MRTGPTRLQRVDPSPLTVRPPMTAAGTPDVRALRSAVLDALVVAPARIVIDLQGFRGGPELRQVVLDLLDEARRWQPAVAVDVRGGPWQDDLRSRRAR
jgi:hypothetical protein